MNANITTPLLGEDPQKTQKNIEALVAAKGALIRKACGASAFSVSFADGNVTYSLEDIDQGIVPAATELLAALGQLAACSRWISSKEKEVSNERYAFRTFLLRLGLSGDAHRAARTALLRNLSGDAAYSKGRPHRARPARYYSILRPIGPGTFPKTQEVIGFHNYDRRTYIPAIDHEAWGYIDYTAPLTDREASSYDLIRG